MKRQQFFIVGVQRSGTSYLNKYLDSHPDICMARIESKLCISEPKFFLNPNMDKSDYEHFYYSYPAKVYGEKSCTYIERPEEVSQNIKNNPLSIL